MRIYRSFALVDVWFQTLNFGNVGNEIRRRAFLRFRENRRCTVRRGVFSCKLIQDYFSIDLYLSYEFLNWLIVVDCLMAKGRAFHECTALIEKKFFLRSRRAGLSSRAHGSAESRVWGPSVRKILSNQIV